MREPRTSPSTAYLTLRVATSCGWKSSTFCASAADAQHNRQPAASTPDRVGTCFSNAVSVATASRLYIVRREQSLPLWSNSNMARRWQQKCPEFGWLHLSTLILNDLLMNSRTRATTNWLRAREQAETENLPLLSICLP